MIGAHVRGAVGATIGQVIDNNILDYYRCLECQFTFQKNVTEAPLLKLGQLELVSSVTRRCKLKTSASWRLPQGIVARGNRLGEVMADTISPERRSRNMAAIRSRDTKPEIAVRKLLHALGFRFRLHRNDLPGCPDIVLPRYKTVVFVNGCFWHQHEGCRLASKPGSRQEYWHAKLARNVARDKCSFTKLTELGWKVIVVWECDLRDPNAVAVRLQNLLQQGG